MGFTYIDNYQREDDEFNDNCDFEVFEFRHALKTCLGGLIYYITYI